MQPDWVDPAWRAEADSWAEAQLDEIGLARTGVIEQQHVRPWATALRIPTTGGVVWFKATLDAGPGCPPEGRHPAPGVRPEPEVRAPSAR
jgi:hypothetical protein